VRGCDVLLREILFFVSCDDVTIRAIRSTDGRILIINVIIIMDTIGEREIEESIQGNKKKHGKK